MALFDAEENAVKRVVGLIMVKISIEITKIILKIAFIVQVMLLLGVIFT